MQVPVTTSPRSSTKTSTSKLNISAVDYTDSALSTGLNLSDLAEGEGSSTSLQLQGGKTTINLTDGTSTLKTNSILSDSNAISTTTTLSFVNDTATAPAALSGASDITAGATVQDLVDGLNAIAGVRAEFDNNTGDLTVYSDEDFHITDGSVTATLGSFAFDASALTATTQLLSETGSFAVGDTLTLTDGNGYELGSLEIEFRHHGC